MGDWVLGVVLCSPCHGCFMYPLAVAGLGLRYFNINSSVMNGHPFKNPLRVALMSFDIFGLPSDWWANFTRFARVFTECANAPTCWIACVGLTGVLGLMLVDDVLIGRVHRSVAGSLYPRKIILLLYITSQYLLENVTVHPTAHNSLIPIRDAIDSFGTMCPVSFFGRPGIIISHMCVDCTFVPSGKLIDSGFIATRLLSTGVPSMMNIAVAPVSAMACDGGIVRGRTVSGTTFNAVGGECSMITLLEDVTFDVTIVASSSSTTVATFISWVGIGETINARFILSATHIISAPTCQKAAGGNWFLCCALNDGVCPAAAYCWKLQRVQSCWCPAFRQCAGHVCDVWLSSTSKPHE